MSLRILFADDSVTAQNMGRKILTEAGYEVVAVSNGAAAVKKIAEQKPDIIILDVYMPGYSGLEVCEKVRGSMETLKTPVLLTVGKMEPYKPEDANRVKADGVIVKPFEASDLLAIVKKFEERIGQTPVMAQQPVLVDRFQEEIAELPIAPTAPQPTVEVPDHMATTSAFSDLLGAEPSVSVNHFEPPPPAAAREAPAAPFAARTTIPDYELPVSWREREGHGEELPIPAAEPVLVQPAAEPKPGAIIPPPPPPPPVASRPLQIPVYEEREPGPGAYEVLPTSAPPTGEIEIPREPELEETAAEATRNTVAEIVEPGLMPTRQPFEPPRASMDAMTAAELAPVKEPFTPAAFQDIPADIVSHLPPPVEAAPATPERPPVERLSDADFEARVAAAMSAYSHAQENATPAPELTTANGPPPAAPPHHAAESHARQISPATEPPARTLGYQPPAKVAAEARPSEIASVAPAAALPEQERAPAPVRAAEPAPPTFEYRPPVRPAPEAPKSETPASEALADVATSVPRPEPESMTAADETRGADHHSISQAVHRVMERLKPELVEEIVRELKSKKE